MGLHVDRLGARELRAQGDPRRRRRSSDEVFRLEPGGATRGDAPPDSGEAPEAGEREPVLEQETLGRPDDEAGGRLDVTA